MSCSRAHGAGLTRLGPAAARDAMASGATLIDIRSDSQIAADGVVPGAVVIPRNVLEGGSTPRAGIASRARRGSTNTSS
jgi:hypothetical protein